MQDSIASLVSALFCLIPIGFMGLVALGFVALFVWIISRTTRPKTAAELAADREKIRADVEKLMPKVRPWQPEGLADLSTNWDARWQRLAGTLKVHDGTIPGVQDPEGPPWVAFTFKVRGASRPDGQMHARTTARRFDYRITPQSIEISVDDEPLGQMQPDGTLLDAAGQSIGHARRPKGTPASFSMGNMVHITDRRERSYAVDLHGRTVAWLANPPVRRLIAISIGKRKPPQYPPALTIAEKPSEEETTWLLALAILQVAFYNVLETIWTN